MGRANLRHSPSCHCALQMVSDCLQMKFILVMIGKIEVHVVVQLKFLGALPRKMWAVKQPVEQKVKRAVEVTS